MLIEKIDFEKELKILFFIDSLRAGGKERRLTELIKKLKNYPHINIEVVVMDDEIHYTELLDYNIKFHFLHRKLKWDPNIFYSFFKICKLAKPDLVHCWDGMTAVYSIPAIKLLSIPLINGMITNAPSTLGFLDKLWLFSKITFPFSRFILSNSKSGLEAYKAPSKKSGYIHNGFNFERIKNLGDPKMLKSKLNIKTKYVIGMVGTFSRTKDYKTFYSAAQILLLKRNDITFIALGQDTDTDLSKEQISLKNEPYFRLLGKKMDVESYINIMDLCILSTFNEGISNSILEYMAQSKIVIATACPGVEEIIIDKKNGYLVEKSNPHSLADKIDFVLDIKDSSLDIGKEALKTVEEEFSIDKMVKSYLLVCKTISKN